ncbi:hypothetical protein D3C76_1469770 [compost metagenome]
MQRQFQRFADDLVVEPRILIVGPGQVHGREYLARQRIAGLVYQVQGYPGFPQQLDIQRREHGAHPPGLVLELLDQHGKRLLAQMHQDLVQRMQHPDHFGGDRDASAPHR